MNAHRLQTRRLQTLATFLHKLAPEKLDLRNWRTNLNGGCQLRDDSLTHDCGTTACAVGWACAMPEFRAEGLAYVNALPEFCPKMSRDEAENLYGGYEFDHWDAVHAFFGLSQKQSFELFMAESYEGTALPGDVAKRIKNLLASQVKGPTNQSN